MRGFTVGCLLVVDFFVASTPVLADEATRNRFLAEYPLAAKRIEAVYGHLQIRCDTEQTNAPHLPFHVFYNYSTNSRKRRLDRSFDANAGRLANQTSTFVENANQSFIVDRNNDRSNFQVRGVGAGVSRSLQLGSMFPPGFVSYSFEDERVIDLLNKKGFQIDDVLIEQSDEHEIVVVQWTWLWQGTGPTSRRGEIRFLPNRNWAVESYNFRLMLPDKKWQSFETFAQATYGGDQEGVALINGLKKWQKLDDSTEINVGTWHVTSIGPSVAPDRDFTLAAFDLKYEQGMPTRNYGWLLVAIGAVGLIGSLLVRRWLGRPRAASSTGVKSMRTPGTTAP